jgi:hypothetical protein
MTMLNIFKVLGTLGLMAVCGVAAYAVTMLFLMELGRSLRGNFEYYGSVGALVMIYSAGAIGFLAPGVVIWLLRNKE